MLKQTLRKKGKKYPNTIHVHLAEDKDKQETHGNFLQMLYAGFAQRRFYKELLCPRDCKTLCYVAFTLTNQLCNSCDKENFEVKRRNFVNTETEIERGVFCDVEF